jgi:hypothetical protein
MNYFQRESVVRRADRFSPGNPPDREEEDTDLRCPYCKLVVTKDGEACPECRQSLNEEEA